MNFQIFLLLSIILSDIAINRCNANAGITLIIYNIIKYYNLASHRAFTAGMLRFYWLKCQIFRVIKQLISLLTYWTLSMIGPRLINCFITLKNSTDKLFYHPEKFWCDAKSNIIKFFYQQYAVLTYLVLISKSLSVFSLRLQADKLLLTSPRYVKTAYYREKLMIFDIY